MHYEGLNSYQIYNSFLFIFSGELLTDALLTERACTYQADCLVHDPHAACDVTVGLCACLEEYSYDVSNRVCLLTGM